ncbi:MAG: hypothetical protein P8L18_09305 [Verrucomicrobiota bacterium]|jgi:hypothetical protein|nr:hypothetical protein [Verrucomicrobiota bacterium]
MKKMMILGGLLGFLIGLGFGFSTEGDGLSVLWKSCVAAYAAGLLMRWWGRIWIRCLKDALREKIGKEDTLAGLSPEMKGKEA